MWLECLFDKFTTLKILKSLNQEKELMDKNTKIEQVFCSIDGNPTALKD